MKGRIFTSHLRVHLGELRASGKCLFRFCMGQNWVQMDPPMYARFEEFGPNFGGPMILAHAPCFSTTMIHRTQLVSGFQPSGKP